VTHAQRSEDPLGGKLLERPPRDPPDDLTDQLVMERVVAHLPTLLTDEGMFARQLEERVGYVVHTFEPAWLSELLEHLADGDDDIFVEPGGVGEQVMDTYCFPVGPAELRDIGVDRTGQ